MLTIRTGTPSRIFLYRSRGGSVPPFQYVARPSAQNFFGLVRTPIRTRRAHVRVRRHETHARGPSGQKIASFDPPLSVVTADEQLFAVGDGEEESAGDRSDELDFRESLLVGI